MGDIASLLLVAFGVGIVIGLTGMGGGALMTPALVFLGIPPTTAVANDLVAAAVNKSVGAATHLRHGAPNLKLAGLLIVGSVPTAAAGGWIISQVGSAEEQQTFVKLAIGVALVLAAGTYVLRTVLNLRHKLRTVAEGGKGNKEPETVRVIPTIIVGAAGGLLVGLTSVGSGSLIMVALLMLYPRLAPNRLVGTDLVQAIPLVLAAAIGHVMYAGIDWSILIPLIVGGSPGTYLGARLSSWVPQGIVRRGIAIVLALTGIGMLGLPSVWVGIAGAALLVLGPIFWGMVRKFHGLPPFTDATDEDLQAAAARMPSPEKEASPNGGRD